MMYSSYHPIIDGLAYSGMLLRCKLLTQCDVIIRDGRRLVIVMLGEMVTHRNRCQYSCKVVVDALLMASTLVATL